MACHDPRSGDEMGADEVSPDDAVQAYLAAADPTRRPLYDRVHRLAVQAHPALAVVLSYRMPTFVVGEQRLHLGIWKHGLSLYGWRADEPSGFLARHRDLWTEKGTLKLTPEAMASIDDDELRAFLAATLEPDPR